jgi:hypothetical protein
VLNQNGRYTLPLGARSMTLMGHQGAFLRPRLSARSRFRQATFAWTNRRGRVAPAPAVRPTTASRLKSTLSGPSFCQVTLGADARN